MFLISFIDRQNVGFAKLQMVHQPEHVRGCVRAGLVRCSSSVTCCSRCRARWRCTSSARAVWLARIMLTWGLITVAMGLHDIEPGVLRAALRARRGRSRVLSRRDLLPDAVVPAELPRSRAGDLHARQRAGEHARLAGGRLAAEPQRRRRPGRLAMGVHRHGAARRGRRDRGVPPAADLVSRGAFPVGERKADRRGRAGTRGTAGMPSIRSRGRRCSIRA